MYARYQTNRSRELPQVQQHMVLCIPLAQKRVGAMVLPCPGVRAWCYALTTRLPPLQQRLEGYGQPGGVVEVQITSTGVLLTAMESMPIPSRANMLRQETGC